MTITANDFDRLNGSYASPAAGAWSRPSSMAVLMWLLLFAAELVASVALCDSRLVFTLDDPYIHLAVADQILSGGYGVNAGEYSSPSSSIAWPYILALTEAMHLGVVGPLLINAAAACATVLSGVGPGWTKVAVLETRTRSCRTETSHSIVRHLPMRLK